MSADHPLTAHGDWTIRLHPMQMAQTILSWGGDTEQSTFIPANSMMLGQRRRRWANLLPALAEHLARMQIPKASPRSLSIVGLGSSMPERLFATNPQNIVFSLFTVLVAQC